jgi:nicotinamide mononucleotide adenylyltransferase
MAGKATTTKKASVSTEIVLGQAAQQITKAVAELNLATASVNELSSKADELTLLVANKEEAIRELDVQFTEKERQLTVELDLSFKANTEKMVKEYLRTVNEVSISNAELTALRSELETVKSNTEAQIKREVAVVAATMKSSHENEVKLIQSENRAISSENAAKIGTLATQNKFLEDQVTKLYLQLDAERAAGIERAKAGSVGSINVSGQGK